MKVVAMQVLLNAGAFGKLIREERRKKGYTQAEVADAANVGINFVSQVERGKPTAELDRALRLAAVLGLAIVGGERREWRTISRYIDTEAANHS